MGLRWPFSREKEKKKKGPKSVNIFLGFFFMVNYCLGTGFLGVPFSFFYAGYLAAIPTLLLIAFVSWNNAEWEVETMARAQVRPLAIPWDNKCICNFVSQTALLYACWILPHYKIVTRASIFIDQN